MSYYVNELPAKILNMCYAEFILGVNDDEFEDPASSCGVNTEEIMLDMVRRLRYSDMHMSLTLEPVHWYVRGFTHVDNTRRRGVKATCNFADCFWEGRPVTNEQDIYDLWRRKVIELCKSLMAYLHQTRARIYFRGTHEGIVEVEADI